LSDPASLLARFRHRDHTQGSLLVSVLVLSLPSIVTSTVAFGLFLVVDLRFIGQLGPEAVAASGATNETLRQFFFLLAFGINVTCQMMIARLVGESRTRDAEHVAGQTIVLALTLALAGLVAGLLYPRELLSWVARDPQVIELGAIYLRITLVTLAAPLLAQAFTSILMGAGDTTTPMLIQVLCTPLAILAQWLLIFGNLGLPELGIAGAALGAAIGGGIGVLLSMWVLFSGRCRVHLRREHLVPDPRLLGEMLRHAWSPALLMLARTSMVFVFMWLAGRLGGKVQAAYTIGLRIEMMTTFLALPIANTCATLVGQSLGARDLDRAQRSIVATIAVESALLWPLALGIFLGREALVGLFTRDPEVAAMAAEYLVYSAMILAFYGVYFVSFRTLQAAGDMRSPTVISVGLAAFLGAPLAWFLSHRGDLGATGMWIANLVYAVANTALTVGWMLTGRWTRAHRIPPDTTTAPSS
jgi:putative MATE family efflux protein